MRILHKIWKPWIFRQWKVLRDFLKGKRVCLCGDKILRFYWCETVWSSNVPSLTKIAFFLRCNILCEVLSSFKTGLKSGTFLVLPKRKRSQMEQTSKSLSEGKSPGNNQTRPCQEYTLHALAVIGKGVNVDLLWELFKRGFFSVLFQRRQMLAIWMYTQDCSQWREIISYHCHSFCSVCFVYTPAGAVLPPACPLYNWHVLQSILPETYPPNFCVSCVYRAVFGRRKSYKW